MSRFVQYFPVKSVVSNLQGLEPLVGDDFSSIRVHHVLDAHSLLALVEVGYNNNMIFVFNLKAQDP